MHALTIMASCLSAVKVKKEATPEDYDNEELYMEMQKIYFAVSNRNNNMPA